MSASHLHRTRISSASHLHLICILFCRIFGRRSAPLSAVQHILIYRSVSLIPPTPDSRRAKRTFHLGSITEASYLVFSTYPCRLYSLCPARHPKHAPVTRFLLYLILVLSDLMRIDLRKCLGHFCV